MRTNNRLLTLGVAVALAVAGVSGCGSTSAEPSDARPSATRSSGARPSVAEISASLLKVGDDPASKYTPQEADCIARILVASGLSDRALQGIAAGVPGFEKSAEDDALYQGLVPNISACLVGSLPPRTATPTPTPTPGA